MFRDSVVRILEMNIEQRVMGKVILINVFERDK